MQSPKNKHITPRFNRISHIIGFMLFVIAAAAFTFWPLMEVKYFSVVPDEAFMALNVKNYSCAPLAPLTFYIGHIATDLLGDKLVTLRLLKYFCYLTSIGVSCIYFYKVSHRIYAAVGLFALLMLSSATAAMDIYNWDTGSYPFMVTALLSAMVFLKYRNIPSASLMGLLCGLMIASRITNIIAVPFIVLMICLCEIHVKQKIRICSVFLLSLSASLLATAYLIYGSMSTLSNAWSPSNIITGHGADIDTIKRMLADFNILSLYLTLGFVVSIICLLFTVTTLRLRRHKKLFIILMILMLFLYARALRFDQTAHYGIWQFPTLLFLFIPQLSAILGINRSASETIIPAITLRQWTILLFLLLPAVGSDHFYERFAPLVFFPIVIAHYYNKFSRQLTVFCTFMAVEIVFLSSLKLPVRILSMTNDIGCLSPRTEGILYKDTSALVTQKEIYDILKSRGFNTTFVGARKSQWTYMYAPDHDYCIPHFHYIDFDAEKDTYLRNLINYDALILNLPIYDSPQMIDFLKWLTDKGYKDISSQM